MALACVNVLMVSRGKLLVVLAGHYELLIKVKLKLICRHNVFNVHHKRFLGIISVPLVWTVVKAAAIVNVVLNRMSNKLYEYL